MAENTGTQVKAQIESQFTLAASGDLYVDIAIKPGAKIEGVGLGPRGIYVSIRARPVEGAANTEASTAIAKIFGLPKNAVTLVKGHRSKDKRWLLSGIDPIAAVQKLLDAIQI